jgi:ribonucleoside-diphosphate reductase alpha subunit
MVAAFKTMSEVGVPYVLFKDAINAKSNLRHVAPICSSNLCCEVTIPSWSEAEVGTFSAFNPGNTKGEFGVCNLAAVCLESFVAAGADGALAVDFRGIAAAAGLEVRALNRAIDLAHYPSEECRTSNRRHRPVGVGIMGLANVYALLQVPYGSQRALSLARGIAAAVYYGAMRESTREAELYGAFASYAGSPLSEGLLAPDLWVAAGHLAAGWEDAAGVDTAGAFGPGEWTDLRAAIRTWGARNAYVTAYMPTATTSNIVGQNECFEPFTSNLYVRRTLAGEFVVVNRHLVDSLARLGLWSADLRRDLIAASGSVQRIERVPKHVRSLFLTAREIHPSLIVRTASAMAPFVCQSLSMNLFLDKPDMGKVIRFLFEGWRAGLKTGMYYCHTSPATTARPDHGLTAPSDASVAPDAEASAAEASADEASADAPVEACVRGCTSCSL